MLSQDFIDILSAFTEEKVEYLLVGSYAMAFHGFTRGTGDIDLWVRPSTKNAEKTWNALNKFGAPLSELTIEDLTVTGTVFQIGVQPQRIDIITSIDGVDFDTGWQSHQVVEVNEISVPLIGLENLIINKKASGRPKDIVDVLWLESGEPE